MLVKYTNKNIITLIIIVIFVTGSPRLCYPLGWSNCQFPLSGIVCRALDHISVIVMGCNKIIQIPLFHSDAGAHPCKRALWQKLCLCAKPWKFPAKRILHATPQRLHSHQRHCLSVTVHVYLCVCVCVCNFSVFSSALQLKIQLISLPTLITCFTSLVFLWYLINTETLYRELTQEHEHLPL